VVVFRSKGMRKTVCVAYQEKCDFVNLKLFNSSIIIIIQINVINPIAFVYESAL
jgi:hypothetical protein